MNILIIVESYPPDPTIGSKRWFYISNELTQKFNCNIEIVAATNLDSSSIVVNPKLCLHRVKLPNSLYGRAKSIFSYKTKVDNATSMVQSVMIKKPISEFRKGFQGLLKSILRKVIFNFDWPDRSWDWSSNIIQYLKLKDKMIAGKFDLVIGSTPCIGAVVAAERLAQLYSVPWIADFRDPFAWFYDLPIKENGYLHRKLISVESKLLDSAARVLCVNEELGEYIKVNKEKLEIVPNCAPMDESVVLAERKRKSSVSDALRIAYAGSYNETYLLSPILEAISVLRSKGIKIEFNYLGLHGQRIASDCAKHGINDLLVDHGYKSQAIVSDFLNKVDVVIVCSTTGRASDCVVTGKIFECMTYNTAIVIVGHQGSVSLKKLVDVTGLGEFVSNSEAGVIALSRIINGDGSNCKMEALGFSSVAISEKVFHILEEVRFSESRSS